VDPLLLLFQREINKKIKKKRRSLRKSKREIDTKSEGGSGTMGEK
jgi:hypothetical protein